MKVFVEKFYNLGYTISEKFFIDIYRFNGILRRYNL